MNVFSFHPGPTAEMRYISWLRNCYDEAWEKILTSIDDSRQIVQNQALTSAIKLMAAEGKSPIDPADNVDYYFPVHRLKRIIMKLLSPDNDNSLLIARFQEISSYEDSLYFTWRSLPSLTPKRQPPNLYIKNLLELLNKLPLQKNDKNIGEFYFLKICVSILI